MAFKFQMRDDLIEIVLLGSVTTKDVQEMTEVLWEVESRLETTPDRIADLSEAGFQDLHSKDLVAFAESRRMAKVKNKIKSAIIAPKPEQYGIARMFAAHNQNPDITIMLFKDSASAYKWLDLEPQSTDGTNP